MEPYYSNNFFRHRQGQTHRMEVELFAETDSGMKSFLQTFYRHAPDDLIVERKENIEPRISGREERFKLAREKLRLEVESILNCLSVSGNESRPEVAGPVEGLRSLYDVKRSAFKAQSTTMKVMTEDFCRMKLDLIEREMETDLAFLSK